MKRNRDSMPFRSKDIDLICALRFQGFQPLSNPIEDSQGIRWVLFEQTPQLMQAVYGFLSGSNEARLLTEFRKTRSFILDSPAEKEIDNGNYEAIYRKNHI